MTIVQEADYEGTVVVTQIEGSNRFLNSRISVGKQSRLQEDLAEESAEGPSGLSSNQDLSSHTDEKN